ncbi:hypothetical protein ACTXT7_005007 [Hymenolepis weldensis]
MPTEVAVVQTHLEEGRRASAKIPQIIATHGNAAASIELIDVSLRSLGPIS